MKTEMYVIVADYDREGYSQPYEDEVYTDKSYADSLCEKLNKDAIFYSHEVLTLTVNSTTT